MSSVLRRLAAALAGPLWAALALAGLAAAPAAARDLDAIREAGVLRVGVAELAPWVVETGLDETIGYEVEATALLAEDLGVARELVRMPFGELIYALREGRIDMIASGYSISDERREIVDFSMPYNRTPYKLVASRAAAEGRTTYEAFNDRKLKIGYLIGGLSADVAKENFPKATLVPFESRPDALRALVGGEIDGVVGSDPFYRVVAESRPDDFVVPVAEPLFMSIEAYAVAKGSDALLDALNGWVLEQERGGLFGDLKTRWFEDLLWIYTIKTMNEPGM